jgi:hypothetical protein
MNKTTPLIVAGIIFSLVALLHLLRLIFQFEVTIAASAVPMWVSIVGLIVPTLLAIWMFMASKK